MITRYDFIMKLRQWLTEETCEKLAFEAEMDFAEADTMSCYEQMLCIICSGDEMDFKADLEEWGIFPQEEDDIEGMFDDMDSEW